jgi:hypothetical protein
VEQQDVERIARRTLNELGVGSSSVTVVPAGPQPGTWRIELAGGRVLRITCGEGSTPQWVRQQIFDQVLSK